MTLIIPPGFANAAFTFTASEGTPPFVTTLGLDISDWAGDFVACANYVNDRFTAQFAAAIDSALSLDHTTLSIGQDGPGGSVDSDVPVRPMTRSSTGSPFAISVIMRKVTNSIGRRGRGRMFIPGTLSQSEVAEDGSVAPARALDLNTRAAQFLDDLTAGTGGGQPTPPVLLHSQEPADPSIITGFSVSDLIGIQRGRIR